MTDVSDKLSCLVIGGAGFIGSHLVPLLTATGRRVTVLGRKQMPSHEIQEGVQYIEGSFSELPLIQRLLDVHEEVIHLAYASVPNTSFNNPLGDLLENIPSSVQLFTEAAARGNRLILVSSGGTVYGEPLSLPISEEHPTRPISPYGVTKLTLERYAYLYAATQGLKAICIRPSNAYGEGQRPFLGQGFIATAMASAILNRPVSVFGTRGVIRDYIHVTDIAKGIVAALQKGECGQTYNLGSGVGLSTEDVLQIMVPLLRARGLCLDVTREPARLFDVSANILNSQALSKQTGWLPEVGLDQGFCQTLDWLVATVR